MGLKCGIVGLPNVGKSTLFNALTRSAAAQAANFPFCTIEPNIGRVDVPDDRLLRLATLAGSAKIIPARLEFVDIAGLVAGASEGEGLGNRFLATIREVDAICHVVRCFTDGNITHVAGGPEPIRDIDIVETELMLADMESLERRILPLEKRARSGEKDAITQLEPMTRALKMLQDGKPTRFLRGAGAGENIDALQLLTSRPVLYICNVEEASAATGNDLASAVQQRATQENAGAVIISAAIEEEVAQLESATDRNEFLASLDLAESGLDRMIRAGYGLLDLMTFFTVGPKEARAWTVRRGTTAARAAGGIHGDFERGFIAAETIAFDDYIACGGEGPAKDAGRMRLEGRDYPLRDGDVLHFRFNV